MTDAWLLQSKLSPPSLPADWIARELLPAGAPLPRATVLVGGPGYGKSLALLGLARQAPAGALVVWLTIEAHDAEPATFFRYLIGGLRAHIPDFGRELEGLLQGGAADARALWQRLFSEALAYNLPALVLALDDAHHLDAVGDALVGLVDRLPDGIHVLLSTRRRDLVPTGKARLRGGVVVIDQARLAFTPAEQAAYLARYPAARPERLAALEGWPLGLALAAGGGSVPDAADLAAYLEEELFAGLPEARRTFMLAAATLEELTPEACRWIFQALDAAAELAALEAAHLVQRLAGSPAYRFPAYVREFLQAEAARGVPAMTLAAWHRRAVAFYLDQGRDELALPHLAAARDWPGFAAACEASFARMRFDGRHAQIERWLAAVPAEVLAEEPALLLWQGHARSRGGDGAGALAAYEAAVAGYRAREDERGAFKALVRLFTLAVRQQDAPRVQQLTMQALAAQAAGDREDVADFHLARALAADLRGDQALMRECNEAALAIAPDGPATSRLELEASHVIAHINLFTHAFQRGELARARRHAERAIALAEATGFGPFYWFARFLQAHLALTEGEADLAAALARDLPAGWEELLDWHMRAIGHTVLGGYHLARDDQKAGQAALERAFADFEAAGYAEGRKVPAEPLMWLAARQGQLGRLEALRQEVGAAGARNFYDQALALPYARGLYAAGRLDEAEAVLAEALPEMEAADARLLATHARLFLAATRLRRGDAGAALADRAAALAAIDAHGLGFLRGQDRALWDELAGLDAPAPTASAPPREGRLALRCFGGFEVRLDGVLLDQWPRRKAKLILAALALRPGAIRQLELAELVGDGDDVSGQSILKVNLPVLRRILEPKLDKGGDSAFVKLGPDGYQLVWELVGECDLRAFEATLAQADACRAADPAGALALDEAAVALYRGDLFDENLLDTFFEGERERYRRQALDALGRIAAAHRTKCDFAAAERVLRQAMALAPCDEEPALALMRLLHELGRLERARQVYWDYRKALKQHLGSAPAPEFEREAKALSL